MVNNEGISLKIEYRSININKISGKDGNYLFLYIYADCYDKYFSGPAGEISSPDYPMTYGTNLDCSNYISVPPGQTVVIAFLAFDMQYSYDWVTVRAKIF